MFTFGRDHEKKCAARNLVNPVHAELIFQVVDAVHDVVEGKADNLAVRPILIRAFVEGGGGVWEQTGSWIRKLAAEHHEFLTLWQELAAHTDGKVRFRVACFINDFPRPLANEIGEQLKIDRSKKVREMALARLEEIGT